MKLSSLLITAATIALHMAGGLAVNNWLANHAGTTPQLGVQPSVIEYVQLAEPITQQPVEPVSPAPAPIAVKPSAPVAPAPEPLSIVKASPIAAENKPPHYPRMALRRQQAGTVLLRVHVLARMAHLIPSNYTRHRAIDCWIKPPLQRFLIGSFHPKQPMGNSKIAG